MKSSTSNHSGTRLFFIEFLIVLFFFLIISTVCLRLFVQSHSMTKYTEELFQAQEAAASVAELLEAGVTLFPYCSLPTQRLFWMIRGLTGDNHLL